MSRNIPLTSTIRQRVRTTFLVLLVGAISFAFVSKAVEYIVVQRETNRLGGYFRSIGSLERTDNNEWGDVSQGANLILGSPYLANEDRRGFSSGVMQDIWNADTDGLMSDYAGEPAGRVTGLHNSDFWFYGTLSEREEGTSGSGWYNLTFQVDKVLAGHPEYVEAGKAVSLLFVLKDHEDAIPKIEAMRVGRRYLIRGLLNYGESNTSTLRIRAIDDGGLWYIPVETGAELDLNDPSMSSIKNEIDILNQNQHALYLTGTTDMSAMPEMQQSTHLYYLVDGRWLNHQDDLDGRRVIVIRKNFADTRQLKIGDTISMTLRGLRNPLYGYIRGIDWETWRTYPTVRETFEIVGIYGDYNDMVVPSQSTDSTKAYIPNSVLGADVVYSLGVLNSRDYSFVLNSSRDQEAFVNQFREPLAQIGFYLTFVKNNGAAFWDGVLPLHRSALTGLFVYSLVLLLALALAVFLYLSQRRKDYAILRALGVPKGQANWQVLIPVLFIGAASVLAGEVPAWLYALANTARTFSKLPTPAGVLPSTTLNPLYFCAFYAGLLILVFIFAWAGVWILAQKPVLELLGRAVPAGGAPRTASSFQPDALAATSVMPMEHISDEKTSTPYSTDQRIQPAGRLWPIRGTTETGALARFGFRSIRRNGLKSSLTALVAVGLTVALGWMQWMMEKDRIEVDHLYGTTVVEAGIVVPNSGVFISGGGIIASGTVDQLLASGFIKTAYLEASAGITQMIGDTGLDATHDVSFSILAFDQPQAFFATLTTRDTVQYTPGWDESLFNKCWDADSLHHAGAPAVFPGSLLQAYDLKLGDMVELQDDSGTVYPYLVAGRYTPGLRQISTNVIETLGEPILLPLSALKVIQGKNLYYSKMEFAIDPAKNRDLSTVEVEIRGMVAQKGAGRMPLKVHFWDEELRAVVEPMEKNISLLEVLYPMTLAVSSLIGAGLCLLILLQQARETALLRTLGTGKAGVRVILCAEQVLLSLAGIILGLVVLGLLRQNPGAVLTGRALTAVGFYLLGTLIGSLIGAISVSNKKPLDLLQVKE